MSQLDHQHRDSTYAIDVDEHVQDTTTERDSFFNTMRQRGPLNEVPYMEGNRRERFFESFFVVGVSPDDLTMVNIQECMLAPTTLFTSPESEVNRERSSVVKDFCFPAGVAIKEVDLTDPA